MTMRSSSPSSSSSYSLAFTSLSNRLETIFKKASELCTLCDIEACVIYYGPDGELKTWPKEKVKVRDIALRYSLLNEALRRKKSVNLHGFLNKKKNKGLKNPNKKRKTCLKNVNVLKKQNQTKPDHQSLTPSSLNHYTQSLNPSQFSLFMYNHGDNTLSQIPVSASNFNQDYFSALLEESELKNQLMKPEICGYDQNQNMSMGDITNNKFQDPCVSNKEAVQESVNNFGLNQLMYKEFYGCDQNMSMGNINSNSFQNPCVSNTQHYSAVEESVKNPWLNQLMQNELYGYGYAGFC
ncbi:Transcription factor MADS-box [Arabidopsis thaliana x Arabidopsis arenosa]|uniref:AGL75 n=2 Tax=Arabidopsis TaxID=3701 RepID=A0A178UDM5_ARATH|nr:Transcription factor MADS-box [Arabidopsis thaliana x Arabidopsis arenosa]OAO91815.1 AGL75 [Arabidopsis thaliana]